MMRSYDLRRPTAYTLLATTGLLLAGGGATSAAAQSVTAASSAKIYTPTTLTSLLNMNFGSVVAGAAGGDVILDAGNTIT
jgi:hypothetical protein